MRSLLIAAAATAVGFALPAAAANLNDTSPSYNSQGSNSPGYNTPSYNQQSNDQQNNGTSFGQRNWANSPQGNQNNAGQGWQSQNQNTANIRQRIYQNLSQAGFTDIRIMPRAFLVHARDRDGNPVTMMITPNSVMALTTVPANGNQSMDHQGGSGSQQKGIGNDNDGGTASQ